MLKPEDLVNFEFEQSVIGGYKRETVDTFLKTVTDDYTKLYNENSELAKKLKVCIDKIEEYQKDEQFLKTAILNAEKMNENSLKNIEAREKEIIKAAQTEADGIVEKARIEADGILKSAQMDADKAIQKCELESAAKISEIRARVDVESEILNRMKKEVSDFKENILSLYKVHLNSISKLPDCTQSTEEKEKSDVKPKFTEPVSKPEIVEQDAPAKTSEQEQVADIEDTEVKEHDNPDDSQTEETVEPTSEKTAEFVIAKKHIIFENPEPVEHSFKFKGLKFGADFDIEKDD